MTFTETKGNALAALTPGKLLAHCISADMALGAGIAKQINNKWNVRLLLKSQYGHAAIGDCLITQTADGTIANLVTKSRYWEKPTYKTLQAALYNLKSYCTSHPDITDLLMPQIGCGLDRLRWDQVSVLIKSIFADTDINITIYSL